MPYIRDFLRGREPTSPGITAYDATNVILAWLDRGNKDYERLSQAIGILESCKLELYRRMVAPYEDKKCEENGDVF